MDGEGLSWSLKKAYACVSSGSGGGATATHMAVGYNPHHTTDPESQDIMWEGMNGTRFKVSTYPCANSPLATNTTITEGPGSWSGSFGFDPSTRGVTFGGSYTPQNSTTTSYSTGNAGTICTMTMNNDGTHETCFERPC